MDIIGNCGTPALIYNARCNRRGKKIIELHLCVCVYLIAYHYPQLRDALQDNCQMLYQFPNKVYGSCNLDLVPKDQQLAISGNLLIPIVREMARRSSIGALDKICGLGYILGLKHIPTFSSSQTPESAWQQLIRNLGYELKLELLFRYPHPGPDAAWAPTWSQVVACLPTFTPSQNVQSLLPRFYSLPSVDNRCRRYVVAVEGCVRGVVLTQGPRAGIFNVKYTHSPLRGVQSQIIAIDTTMSIPDGEYAILSSTMSDSQMSALCRVASVSCEVHRAFEKVAAIEVITKTWHTLVRSFTKGSDCCFT